MCSDICLENVLMDSDNVKRLQLRCDSHTVPELHKGTAAIFLMLLTIVVLFRFFFECVCYCDSPISFSIV